MAMTGLPAGFPPDLAAKLDEAVRVIVDLAHPELVILFGSYAEGTQTPESDLDLLVVAETDSPAETAVRVRRGLRDFLRPLALDILVYPPEAWERYRWVWGFVTREADQRGVRLYAAS
jgi:uncharacterized protein